MVMGDSALIGTSHIRLKRLIELLPKRGLFEVVRKIDPD